MERKIIEFSYEDTDKKIEISLYGLIFEINKEKIVEKDINNINNNDEMIIKDEIEDIIGKGAVERINNKRINDGYKEMTLDVQVAVLTCIYKTYIEATTGNMIDEINNKSYEMIKKAEQAKNREQRRNYNRNQYRRNRKYRRY